LFERFELPEEENSRDVPLEHLNSKKINFNINKEVTDLGLHVLFLSAVIEIPKIITRRN
jgi:hypothetical protein